MYVNIARMLALVAKCVVAPGVIDSSSDVYYVDVNTIQCDKRSSRR